MGEWVVQVAALTADKYCTAHPQTSAGTASSICSSNEISDMDSAYSML